MTRNLMRMSRPLSVAVAGSSKSEVICPKYMRKKGKVMPARIEARVPAAIKYFSLRLLNLKMVRNPVFYY